MQRYDAVGKEEISAILCWPPINEIMVFTFLKSTLVGLLDVLDNFFSLSKRVVYLSI